MNDQKREEELYKVHMNFTRKFREYEEVHLNAKNLIKQIREAFQILFSGDALGLDFDRSDEPNHQQQQNNEKEEEEEDWEDGPQLNDDIKPIEQFDETIEISFQTDFSTLEDVSNQPLFHAIKSLLGELVKSILPKIVKINSNSTEISPTRLKEKNEHEVAYKLKYFLEEGRFCIC